MGGTPRAGSCSRARPARARRYLAKAMAAEAGVPFLFVSVVGVPVDVSTAQPNRKIRAYFKALRKAARTEGGAIGFIEEIDAIGPARGHASAAVWRPARSTRSGCPAVTNGVLSEGISAVWSTSC